MTNITINGLLKNKVYDQAASVAPSNNASRFLSESTVVSHSSFSTKRKAKNLTECSASNHIQNVEAEVVAKRTKIPTVTPTSSTDGDLEFTTESSADEEFDIQQAPSNDSTESVANQFARIWKTEPQECFTISKKVNKIYEEYCTLSLDKSILDRMTDIERNKTEMNSSGIVKKIFSLIDDSSVEDLILLGAGELSRLTQIVNKIHRTFEAIAKKVDISRIMVLEDKLQCAFIRALTANDKNKEQDLIEKFVIYDNSPSGSIPNKFIDYKYASLFIKNIKKNPGLLKGLCKKELNNLDKTIEIIVSNEEYSSFKKITKYHDRKMEVRSSVVSSGFQFPGLGSISHKTTLFALIHKEIKKFLGDRHILLEEINNTVVRSVLNHDRHELLVHTLKNILSDKANLSPARLEYISKSLDKIVKNFRPTENVGHQIDSPLAMNLHNNFAKMCLESPSEKMVMVAKKIYEQFIDTFKDQEEVLKCYLDEKSSTYPLFKKKSNIEELKIALSSGSDIALAIDFQHFYCEKKIIQKWRTLGKGKENQDCDKGFVRSEILNRLYKEQFDYTYKIDISNYRGEQVPLPKFELLLKTENLIGLGSHRKSAVQFDSGNKLTRHSTIKRAVYGTHAIHSSKADTAQGCGTTGRANLHLWPMAYVNNKIRNPDRQFTPTDTANYLLMLAAVLTADGGHTLTEVLATANIAARRAGNLLEILNKESSKVEKYFNEKFFTIDPVEKRRLEKSDEESYKLYKRCLAYSAGKKVSKFFSEVLYITEKMDTVTKDPDLVVWENFKCYDMIFSKLGDNEFALNYMKSIWGNLLEKFPVYDDFDEGKFWAFK